MAALETRKYAWCTSGQLRIANEFTSLVFIRYHSRFLARVKKLWDWMFPTSTDLVEVIIFSLHHGIFRITYYQNLQKLQNSDISETLLQLLF